MCKVYNFNFISTLHNMPPRRSSSKTPNKSAKVKKPMTKLVEQLDSDMETTP
jgi:hypothetical protein